MENKKTKKKLKISGIIILILLMYLLFSFGYYVFTLPIKQIEIKNNYYLTDDYIIEKLKLDKKNIFEFSTKKAEKKLNKENLVSNSKVRKNLFGKVTIDLNEEKILFYNWNNSKVISKNKEMEFKEEYLGIPSLINYVPDDIYKKLINKLDLLDREIILLISEIEYSPDTINDITIDENRFLLRMNDGMKVYANLFNMKKMNSYLEIHDAILKTNAIPNLCLFLNSSSTKNYVYGSCDKPEAVEGGEGSNE